jgi:hypothetical protein
MKKVSWCGPVRVSFCGTKIMCVVSAAGFVSLSIIVLPGVGAEGSAGPLPPALISPSVTQRKGAALLKVGDWTSGLVVKLSRKALVKVARAG